MALFLVAPFVVLLVVGLAVHRHRARNRWVSPYTGFRAAAAKVTRTAEGPFDIAGARMIQVR